MLKVLVIQTASIGDVVLSTPVIENLHTRFPEAQIDFLLKKGTESLFHGHPFLHEVLIWDKTRHKYINLYKILIKIRQNRYDFVFNLQRFFSTGLLTAFSRAWMKRGFNNNPLSFLFTESVKHTINSDRGEIHEVDRNLSMIRSLVDKVRRRPCLYPTKEDEKKMRQYKKGDYICIAPASLWFTKQFPVEKWTGFIQEVPGEIKIYLLGSANDSIICGRIVGESLRSGITDLAGRLSLLETAALMKGARMNLVNDSAPQHLASAVNAPVTTIFCSTVPAFGFGPLSDHAVVVETKEKLLCRPCGLHGLKACPERHFKCAYNIQNQQLLAWLTN